MRYYHPSLYLLWALCLFISCVDDREKHSPDQEAYAVFTPSIAGGQILSRASNDTWDKDDKVGIYMVSHNTTISLPGLSAGNHPYKAATSGTETDLVVVPGNARILYPSNGNEVNFIAYYPYNTDVTINNHIYKVDVTDQTDLPAIDLIYHKGTTAYSKDNRNASLAFTHQLTKLLIQVIPASSDVSVDLSSTTGSLVGFPTTADFTLSTGALSNMDNAATTDNPITLTKDDINPSNSLAQFEAIVIPTEGDGTFTRSICFEIDGENYTYPIPKTTPLEQGVAYSYIFKFTGNSIVLVQNTITDWDGGILAWGNYLLTSSKIYFDLLPSSTTGNTVTISTNAPTPPTFSLSENADSQSDDQPVWITGTSLSAGSTDTNGWTSYTLTFGTEFNIDATSRTGYILLTVDGLTLAVRVTQSAGAGLYVYDPEPSTFEDMPYGGKTDNTFTIKTNSQDADITVETDNDELITITNKERGDVDNDGSSTWTITFDVTASSSETLRAGDIAVTISGITKTVSVEQPAYIVMDNNANCFMVKPGSAGITFNPSRATASSVNSIGAGYGTGVNAYTVEKVWDDTGAVKSVSIDGGIGDYGVITVKPTETPGNALIVVKENGSVIWSYHIWVVDYEPDLVTNTNVWVNNGFTVMDRNLGATKASLGSGLGTGLFYQWGRKDPFPATDNVAEGSWSTADGPVTSQFAHTNPDKFVIISTVSGQQWNSAPNYTNSYWSSSKGVLDPCPSGWKVPAFTSLDNSPFNGLTADNRTTDDALGGFGIKKDNVLFPATGTLSYKKEPMSIGSVLSLHSATVSASSYYNAYYYTLGNTQAPLVNGNSNRAYGRTIRCVKDN